MPITLEELEQRLLTWEEKKALPKQLAKIENQLKELDERIKVGTRAEFIKAAMQGILANSDIRLTPSIVANSAELYADETLKKIKE